VKRLAALALTLFAAHGRAATAYVSDELILGVYADQNGQGQRLATLHSGATVESLSAAGDYTQVRLADGVTGWVKTAYLTTNEPSSVRLKQVQDELDRLRATTPGLAQAAEHAEVERLQRQVAALRADKPADVAPPQARADAPAHVAASLFWVPGLAAIGGLIAGFCAGYTTLARRIKHRFGGIKVY
jgi:hypothetical protein